MSVGRQGAGAIVNSARGLAACISLGLGGQGMKVFARSLMAGALGMAPAVVVL
jgi:hypothetical protein